MEIKMSTDILFSNSFVKNIKEIFGDYFKIEYKNTGKIRRKEFSDDITSFYAKKAKESGEISYVHNDFGLSKIESSFSLEETIDFFESREIAVHNKEFKCELADLTRELIEKYTDLSIGNKKFFSKTILLCKEKFYFRIIDDKNIEMIKSIVLAANFNHYVKAGSKSKFRIDFAKNNFKYGKKNYEYNDYNKEKMLKNLKVIVYYMLKSYAVSVKINLTVDNFDDQIEVLKLLNY
jgi:hypothetical protein